MKRNYFNLIKFSKLANAGAIFNHFFIRLCGKAKFLTGKKISYWCLVYRGLKNLMILQALHHNQLLFKAKRRNLITVGSSLMCFELKA